MDGQAAPGMKVKRRYLYLEFGNSARHQNELQYSLMTLLKHHDLAHDEVIVYTETPERYQGMPVVTESISDRFPTFSTSKDYWFRLKPCVVLHALQKHRCTVLFLDTDTIVNQNLDSLVESISPGHALLNRFECRNPYPDLDFELQGASFAYTYSREHSVMYNSGVIGLREDHIELLTQAIALIDAMSQAKVHYHTIEQTAISEMLRLHNVRITEVSREVTHYVRTADKNYMAYHIAMLFERATPKGSLKLAEPIKLSWLRSRLFKWFSIA
jgi:hypothetical protein